MRRRTKAVLIAAVVLLLAGTLAFAQAPGSALKTGEQETPFSLGENAWCGGPRGGNGGGYGGCGGPGGYNGGPDSGNGNGGGFDCH